MLEAMRKHSQSFLIYLLFFALIVVFAVSFGPGSVSCGSGGGDYAAEVDGETISRQEFALRYQQQLDVFRRNFSRSGNDLDPEMIERLGLRTQVIDELINKKLLSQEARRRGMVVTDDELLNRLQTVYGVTNVTFDQYEGWVSRNFRIGVAQFEEEVRGEIASEKLARAVTENITVGDAELKNQFLRNNNRAKIAFVRFGANNVEVPEPTEAEVAGLLGSEPEAIQKRFDELSFKYRTPKEVRARQILKRLARDASDADVAQTRNALVALREQLEGGADFASLARQHSDDEASKNAGGDMGFLKVGQVLRPITDAVFAMDVDAISEEPVRSPLGMHLFQVTEIKAAGSQPFEEVKEEVARELLKQRRGLEAAQAQAAALLAQLQSGTPIEDLTATQEESDAGTARGRPVRTESDWILKTQDSIPRIGQAPTMVQDVFALTLEAPVAAQTYEVSQHHHVVVLTERERPDLDKFESTKEDLRQEAVYAKRGQIYREWLKALRDEADVILNPAVFVNEVSG